MIQFLIFILLLIGISIFIAGSVGLMLLFIYIAYIRNIYE